MELKLCFPKSPFFVVFKFHYVQMEHIQSSLTSQAFSMFKFHYVQMEQFCFGWWFSVEQGLNSTMFRWNFPMSLIISLALALFKFHYVQMERLFGASNSATVLAFKFHYVQMERWKPWGSW